MKRNLILLLGILTLFSCKEQVAKALFDTSNLTNQTKYFYKHESDKLISQTEKTYTIMFGQVVDSMISSTNFKYNAKNLLIKKVSRFDFTDNLAYRIFEYNNNDSLIKDMSVSSEGDTTFWFEYDYFSDGRKIVFDRKIISSYFNNPDLIEDLVTEKFDTIQLKYEYHYEGGICTNLKQYESKNNLIKTIKFDYQNDLLIKETHMSYFDSMELIEKTKIYDYSKSKDKPDFYSLDPKKDTIEMCINEFEKDQLLSSTILLDYGNLFYKTLFENGKEISMTGFDRKMNHKSVELYKYFENGDLKETKTYN